MTHALFFIPWHDLLMPKPSWLEKIVRPMLVYLVLLIVFRTASKRELAQATLFDFLIVLLISNVVQNAMIGEDNSVLGATAGAIMLVLLSGTLNKITASNKRVRRVIEGKAALLIRDGEIFDEVMKSNNVSRNDLLSAVRKQGVACLGKVSYAILELDGSISIIVADDDDRPHDALPEEVVGRRSAEDESSA